jgi:hypothetical protein
VAAADVEASVHLSVPQPEPGEGSSPRRLERVLCLRMGIVFIRVWRLLNLQEHIVIILGLGKSGKTTVFHNFL